MSKLIAADVSTLVDLKAELFRKQAQVKRQKELQHGQTASTSSTLFVKGAKSGFQKKLQQLGASKKQKGSDPEKAQRQKRIQELEEAVREDERRHSLSKRRLEEKAALYEKLQTGHHFQNEDNEKDSYLVNFAQKASEARARSSSESSDEVKRDGSDDDDDNWVEFVDSLGRTRKCLRADLPKFTEQDASLRKRNKPTGYGENSEMLSTDMRRELERRQWEEEEKNAAPSGPVHYQHVLKGEARDHGAGYFPFAVEETERQEQMKLLDDLRKQTTDQRLRSQQLKDKRQLAMKARLQKVKERKKIKLDDEEDLSTDDDDDDEHYDVEIPDSLSQSNDDVINIPLPPNSAPSVPRTEDSGRRKPKDYVRPWDVDKPLLPQETWIDRRRQERPSEFAPPSTYK